MNSPTAQVVEQAIAKQEAEDAGTVTDDNKNPKGDSNDKPKDDQKAPAKDADDSKSKSGKDDKPAGDKDADKPKYDKDGKRIESKPADEEPEKGDVEEKPEEGEFTADDALEVEAPKPNDKPEAPKDNAGIQLSPDEQKYIADNIGEPIVIRGIQGEGDNAKEVEIKAYSPADIPANFKFANDQQLAAATTGFQNLERKANELLGNFRQNQSQQAATDFEQRENNGIRDDIADLQKEGRFPKFTVRPGADGFDDSPEAKIVDEVIAVMQERNETYLKQYNQGRPYKHIGFAEAFDIWESRNPERQAAKKADADQQKEDEERQNHAEDGRSNRGMSSSNIVRPTVRPGTTTRDILARIDNDDSF